jgi:uncharacterized membrane protein YqgA involved in biofilm formation
MIGTFLNVGGIIVGGLIGSRKGIPLSQAQQSFLKSLLAALTVFAGFKMIWQGMNGGMAMSAKLIGIAFLAMIVGRLIGKALHLQHFSNLLGSYARQRMEQARPSAPSSFSDGFVTCSILFCAAPISVLGALQEGLYGNWMLLGVKTILDALAAMAFVGMFGRGVLLSALLVLAWQGLITLAAQVLAQAGWFQAPVLRDSLNITCGLIVTSIPLIILEVRKVELADYLPSLIIAPALAYWWLAH